MRICRDCKHSDGAQHICGHDESRMVDVVTGKSSYLTCRVMRTGQMMDGSVGLCGLEAKHYEEKQDEKQG